jgi:hypothetical protein
LATAAAALVVVALFATVGFQSPGYDDEIVNIDTVGAARSFAELVTRANSWDFHPPGQYVIDKFLFDCLGDWSRVRAACGAIAAASVVAVWLGLKSQGPPRAFAWVAICLNPTLLLWCASLRWYCFFVVLLNLVLLLLLRPPRRPLVYWACLFSLLLALLYVGYLCLVVAPVVMAVALYQRRSTLAGELPVAAGAALAAAVLAGPQLIAFFSVHLDNMTSDMVDTRAGLGVMALHLTSGQGAMPFSIFGAALAAANLLMIVVAVRHRRSLVRQQLPQLLGAGILALLASGIGVRPHTLVALSTLQGAVQAAVYEQIPSVVLRGVLMVLVAIGNFGGIINVAGHSGTIKGSWNTPYPLVLETFRARTAGCTATTAITHDPVLAFHLRRQASDVIFFEDDDWQERLARSHADCLIAFQTYRGALAKRTWLAYAAAVQSLPGRVSIDRLGCDTDAAFKRLFDPDIPDDYVTMTTFRR